MPVDTLYLGFGVKQSLHLRRTGVRQTGVTQVMEDRTGAGVAPSPPNQSPNGCLGQQSPHLARMGQQFSGGVMEQKAIYVGMDVAKAQVDVAVRPTDERWEGPPRPDRDPQAGLPAEGP